MSHIDEIINEKIQELPVQLKVKCNMGIIHTITK